MSKDPRSLFEDSGQESVREQVHHMVCVHGSAGYLEEPENLTVAREHSGLRMEARGDTRAIVTIPIPTTLVFKGSRLAVRSILLDFTASPGVALNSVQIFSGSRLISSHKGLSYSGRNRYRQFEIEGDWKLNMALSVSAAVGFDSGYGYFNLVSVSAVFIERVSTNDADTP